jgi:hypothetical protein
LRMPMPVLAPLPAAVLPDISRHMEGAPVVVPADEPTWAVMPKRLQPPQFGAVVTLFLTEASI